MKRPRFFNIAETLSGAVCLISVIAIGILMMRGGKRARQYRLFGWRAVVLGADAAPMIGMPMISKTCAYVWTVLIGFFAMRQKCK